MEDEFWSVLLKLGVPYKTDTVGVVGQLRVGVVAGQQQFGMLGRPVERGDAAIARPPFVCEAATQRYAGAVLLITVTNTSVNFFIFAS